MAAPEHRLHFGNARQILGQRLNMAQQLDRNMLKVVRSKLRHESHSLMCRQANERKRLCLDGQGVDCTVEDHMFPTNGELSNACFLRRCEYLSSVEMEMLDQEGRKRVYLEEKHAAETGDDTSQCFDLYDTDIDTDDTNDEDGDTDDDTDVSIDEDVDPRRECYDTDGDSGDNNDFTVGEGDTDDGGDSQGEDNDTEEESDDNDEAGDDTEEESDDTDSAGDDTEEESGDTDEAGDDTEEESGDSEESGDDSEEESVETEEAGDDSEEESDDIDEMTTITHSVATSANVSDGKHRVCVCRKRKMVKQKGGFTKKAAYGNVTLGVGAAFLLPTVRLVKWNTLH